MLSRPRNCEFMSLLPHGHPSGRHSEVDWSKPDLDKYPDFTHAEVKHMMPPDGVDPAGCDVSVVPLLLTRNCALACPCLNFRRAAVGERGDPRGGRPAVHPLGLGALRHEPQHQLAVQRPLRQIAGAGRRAQPMRFLVSNSIRRPRSPRFRFRCRYFEYFTPPP